MTTEIQIVTNQQNAQKNVVPTERQLPGAQVTP